MQERIVILALAVAAISSVAAGAVCLYCPRMERRKRQVILQAVREQDRLAREIARACVEEQQAERKLLAKLRAGIGPVDREKSSNSPAEADRTDPI